MLTEEQWRLETVFPTTGAEDPLGTADTMTRKSVIKNLVLIKALANPEDRPLLMLPKSHLVVSDTNSVFSTDCGWWCKVSRHGQDIRDSVGSEKTWHLLQNKNSQEMSASVNPINGAVVADDFTDNQKCQMHTFYYLEQNRTKWHWWHPPCFFGCMMMQQWCAWHAWKRKTHGGGRLQILHGWRPQWNDVTGRNQSNESIFLGPLHNNVPRCTTSSHAPSEENGAWAAPVWVARVWKLWGDIQQCVQSSC